MNQIKYIQRYLLRCCIILPGFFSVSVVHAHNSLLESTPTGGEVLHSAPATIYLRFSDSTYLMTVEVKNQQGKNVLTDFTPGSQPASSFTMELPEVLDPGRYTVNWMVEGDDTHEIEGEFDFSIIAENQ